ncbi:MAG: SpoIVB peptidase S55 domain-containing protein [Planctomycetota bacterium]
MKHSGVFGKKTTISISVLLALLFFDSFALGLDSKRYISVDEVQTDMEAYCLTVYSGAKIERFELKILSVIKDRTPGRDMILVKGLDERFVHSSAVHGCSGSPVFIDGRLAGALAAGWDGSLDSLYLVRPIEEMLETGSVESAGTASDSSAVAAGYDYSQPIDLDVFFQKNLDALRQCQTGPRMSLPLAVSLPADVCESNRETFEQMGFMPFAASHAVSAEVDSGIKLERGGTLAAVLCGGDISMSAIGTVTEIVGDQVYGFGHSFTGQGPINIPMAAGVIHTVIAHRRSSFKFGTAGPIQGTLLFDQEASVRGTIGEQPNTIPLKISVKRYNDPKDRDYDCFLAVERNYTPRILMSVLAGAAQMQGKMPYENTVTYEGQIKVKGFDPIHINNISSGQGIDQMIQRISSTVGMLLNNPFQEVVIESIEAGLQIIPEDRLSSIRAVDLSQTTVKPGQSVTALVTLKSKRSEETAVKISLTIPKGLPKGKYPLQILGPDQYQQFVSKMAPHRFRAVDMPTLHAALQESLQFRRDRLHIVMPIPSTGLVIRQHELADLPPTKMLLMQDSKRLTQIEPYKNWVENSIEFDRVADGTAKIELTVDE